jgi:hypothetical protein
MTGLADVAAHRACARRRPEALVRGRGSRRSDQVGRHGERESRDPAPVLGP